ncbi:ribonuclease H-like domain-containing protein [Tanacetum coccineum]|uniref:Ribonuclease H-like domain-containing protein n=1 Tax=Tanacetum coccineum TaxID=301880 RepID=A0ABQ5C7T0_9ASTR
MPSAIRTSSLLSHTNLTSPEVNDDIFDPEEDIIENLLNLDKTKDLPPYHDNQIEWQSHSNFGTRDQEMMIFPLNAKSARSRIRVLEDVIKEVKCLLTQSPLANYSLDNDLVVTILEMFTDEHALDYSSPPLYDDVDDDLYYSSPTLWDNDNIFDLEPVNDDTYDDPFDFKEEKIKESKLLIDELDLPESNNVLPFPEYDSVFYEDFSEVDALSSTNNEDKVFNPGILIHENLFEVTNFATPDKNVKKTTNASLILKDFNPPLYELPFHKEVPGLGAALLFSSEMRKKSSTPGFSLLKEFIPLFSRNYLIGALKLSKSPKFLKARWRFFLALTKRTSESWMFRVSTSIPLDKLKYGGLGCPGFLKPLVLTVFVLRSQELQVLSFNWESDIQIISTNVFLLAYFINGLRIYVTDINKKDKNQAKSQRQPSKSQKSKTKPEKELILLMVKAADLEISMHGDYYGMLNNVLAKLLMLKLEEYEMWKIRIKQYFQIQDYALWEVIENKNSWVPIPVTAPESGPSTALKMTVPSTAKEKICKKNDSMFVAIKARFGGNAATKKTQKALLKQQYENFNASSSESLDSIFNRLQKLVSRLAILGVVTPPEDLNVKFLRSLPSEWDTHVVVWMNKPDFDTMGLDDLYNNFKIVEQKVKRSAGANNDDKNLAFLTASGASSINNINTVNPEVSTGTTKVNTASTEISTASFSDATVYAFLSTQPQGSQLVHEDLEQLHDDDLEEMDLKWNMALLSMRARKFYQRTGRKIIIDGSSTAGYDKSKVECFNCHKMGHFARECRAPRSKDNRNWNQGSSSKAVRIEDASEKAMCAIDGAGFDWSDMAEEEIQANMALMAFSDSEVTNDKSCSKSCLQNYEALKKQYDDLLVKLDDTGFKASTYKRGLSILEGQILKYKESEVLFSEEIALLKRSVGHKEYLMGLLRTELEKVKEEKEGFEFKIAKFEKSSKDLDQLLASQITDKSKKGFGYNAVPSPHPLILNRPTPLDLSYSGLEEFKQPEENTDDSLKQQQKTDSSSVKSPLKVDKDWKEKFFCPANQVREEEPKKARKNNDALIIEDWVLDDEDDVEPISKVEKKNVIPTATKKEFVKPEKPVSCPKTSHSCAHKHMAPRAVLMKTGLKTVIAPRLVNTRSVNTGRPFTTARSFNIVRPSYTAHTKSIVHCARPRTYFQNQAQSTVHKPFYKRTGLTKSSYNQNVNTGRQNVNTVRARGFNVVKPSAVSQHSNLLQSHQFTLQIILTLQVFFLDKCNQFPMP